LLLKHLQYLGGYLHKSSLYLFRICTVQITVVAADEAIQCILIGELLLDLGFVFQSLVASFNQVRCVQRLPDSLWEPIKRVQVRLCPLKDAGGKWVMVPYIYEMP